MVFHSTGLPGSNVYTELNSPNNYILCFIGTYLYYTWLPRDIENYSNPRKQQKL